jgi:hypothetical protein
VGYEEEILLLLLFKGHAHRIRRVKRGCVHSVLSWVRLDVLTDCISCDLLDLMMHILNLPLSRGVLQTVFVTVVNSRFLFIKQLSFDYKSHVTFKKTGS